MARSMRPSTMLLLPAILAACLLPHVQGHAGHLHAYPNTPEGNNYIRYLLAVTSPFTALDPYAEIGAIPFNGEDSGAPVHNITGRVELWAYLNQNCTDVPAAGVVPNILITNSAGAPLANTSTFGYAFIGNCSDPGDLYRNEQLEGDDDTNLLWWKGYPTDGNGTIYGNAYQPWKLRSDLPLSLVILPGVGSVPLCANWVFTPKVHSSFYKQGELCNPLPPPPPRPPKKKPSPKRKPPSKHKRPAPKKKSNKRPPPKM